MALITVDPGSKDMKSVVGKLVMYALVAAGAYGLYTILPMLVSFAENMLYLGAMIGVAMVVIMWLSSGGAKAIKYAVFGLAQLSLGWVIEMNPFNILQYRLDEAAEDAKDLLKCKSTCEAKAAELKEKIDNNDKELKMAMSSRSILQDKISQGNGTDNDSDNLERAVSIITSNKEYIDGIMPLYDDILRMVNYTERAYRTASLELDKSKKDLSKKRDLYETVTTASATVNKAWKALKGDDSTNADADKAIAYLTKDISAKIGNIRTGIKITSQLMDSKDLENASKLQTTLNQLKDIDLNSTSYSSTIDDSATKLELGNLKGGSNTYAQYLNQNTKKS